MAAERDAGSRTMLDILLRRRGDLVADAAAVEGPSGRIITCHLRADFLPFPPKWKIGNLQLDASGAHWRPGVCARGGGAALPPIELRRIREVGGRGEWNIKRRLFQVIEAECELGELRLAVPSNTAQLVAQRLSNSSGLPT